MTTTRLRCLLDGDFMHNKGKLAGIPWQLCTILHISPQIGFERETTAAHFYTFMYMDIFFLLSLLFSPHTLKMMSGRHKPGRPNAVCELGRNVLLKNAPLLTPVTLFSISFEWTVIGCCFLSKTTTLLQGCVEIAAKSAPLFVSVCVCVCEVLQRTRGISCWRRAPALLLDIFE